MTVTTIFSQTADGSVESTFDNTYSTARSGSGATLSTDTGADAFVRVGQDDNLFKATHSYFCWETFLSFDTSGITDTDVVSAIVLSFNGFDTDATTTDFTCNAREFNWGATLTTADYIAGASLSGNTLLATFNTSGGVSTAGYNDMTSQAAFLTATNLKTGTVFVVLSSSRHEGNNQPSGDEWFNVTTSEATGTTFDPKLVVTSAPAVAMPPFPPTRNVVWSVY